MQTMTIKELAEIGQVSRPTVTRIAKEIYPNLFENGKTTKFDAEQSLKIMSEIRKKGFVEPSQNKKVASQNEKVESRLDRIELVLEKLSAILAELPKQIQQQKQLSLPSPKQKPAKKQMTFQGFRSICNGLKSRYDFRNDFSVTLFIDRTKSFLEQNGHDRDSYGLYQDIIFHEGLTEKYIRFMEDRLSQKSR